MNEWVHEQRKELMSEWTNERQEGSNPLILLDRLILGSGRIKLQQQWSLLNCLNFIDCVLRKRNVMRHNLLITLEQLVMSFLWIVKEHPNFRFRSPDYFRSQRQSTRYFILVENSMSFCTHIILFSWGFKSTPTFLLYSKTEFAMF